MNYNDFKHKYNGKVLDYDGAYGGQCWDLAQFYFTECLKLPASILGGCGLVSNMLNEPKISLLLKYFDEIPTNNMIAGDVVIWSKGHIAIFDSWDGKNCYYLTQNPGATKIGTCNLGGTMRAFRLKGSKPVQSVTKYLNISPEADYRTVYNSTNLIPANAVAKLNPKKYGGLSYKILKDCGNNVVKIKTDMFGEVYISSKAQYYGSVDSSPKYKYGNY